MRNAGDVRRLSAAPETLTIEWAEGGGSDFASLWLLDNRAEDRDAHSGQRLIDIADLPESPRIRSAEMRDGAGRIVWEGDALAASFQPRWLHAQASSRGERPPEAQRRHWLEGGNAAAPRVFRSLKPRALPP